MTINLQFGDVDGGVAVDVDTHGATIRAQAPSLKAEQQGGTGNTDSAVGSSWS